MLRRFGCSPSVAGGSSCWQTWQALRLCAISMANDQRENLTKHLTLVREEAKGQSLDLSDMVETSRGAAKQLQDGLKKVQVDDSKFKGKAATLNASLKAYHTRLANLQNEARAIQGEVDGLLKLMWGTESVPQQMGGPGGAQATQPPPRDAGSRQAQSQSNTASGDFDCDVPPIAQRLEQINQEAPTTAAKSDPPTKKSEVVEGEVIRTSDSPKRTPHQTPPPAAEEIEVESIDIEVEEDAAKGSSPADSMSITDITKDLYERGVNFSDCLDAKSLRQRYRDVLAGRIATTTTATSKPAAASASANSSQYNTTQQPPPPPRPQYHQQQYQQQQPPPNTSETGLAHDPYPNAHRKMIDPMKYVWEVKQELSKEKNIDPNSVDLWSGKSKLEDHKRLYDYPSIQSYPIEVRQKGDSPR